jgi:ferritin
MNMAISKSLNAKFNEQITAEFYSSQLYLAMACNFEERGLKMLCKLYRKQAAEECEHALKFVDYLPTVGGKVTLQAIPQPPVKFASVLAAIEGAHEHEIKVTEMIHELVTAAEKDKDYPSRSFLRWFVDEQVEEVDSQAHLVQIARMAGDFVLQLEGYVARMVNS